MLHELIDELGIQKENTLMIGDTTHDLQMAKNAGVKAIGVSYGAHSIDQLHSQEPAHIVHSIAELRNYFNDYLKSI